MKEIAKYTYDLSQDFDPDVIALSHQAVDGERKAMRARSVMISWEITGGQADGWLGLGISNDGKHFSVLDNIAVRKSSFSAKPSACSKGWTSCIVMILITIAGHRPKLLCTLWRYFANKIYMQRSTPNERVYDFGTTTRGS